MLIKLTDAIDYSPVLINTEYILYATTESIESINKKVTKIIFRSSFEQDYFTVAESIETICKMIKEKRTLNE